MPGAEPKTILAAVEWIWSHRGKNMFWRPGVLTEELNKQDPTAPKVTIIESESIFLQLQEKGLVYVKSAPDGFPAFWLHESKINQWEAFIGELGGMLPNFAHNPAHQSAADQTQEKTNKQLPQMNGLGAIKEFIDGKPFISGTFDIITICFFWACMADCHTRLALFFYCFGLLIAYAPLAYCCGRIFQRHEWETRIFCFVVLNIVTMLFAKHNVQDSIITSLEPSMPMQQLQKADVEVGMRPINMVGLPVIPLMLSNSFFRYRWRTGPYRFNANDCEGYVVFPTTTPPPPFVNPPEIAFQFVATNCSTVDASNVVIKFTGFTNAIWRFASGWNEAVFDESEETRGQHMEFLIPSMQGHSNVFCPMVVFAQSNIFPSFAEMLIAGPNVDSHWLRFHMHTLITNQKPLPKPYVVRARKLIIPFGGGGTNFDDTFPLIQAWESNIMNLSPQHP